MLALSTLHNLLGQILSPTGLHTAVLLSPAGELVSAASDPLRPKDEIRILVGLAAEVWQETRDAGDGMVESEFGRIAVFPVSEHPYDPQTDEEPLILLALNSKEAVDWEELEVKGRALVEHLAKPLGRFRPFLGVAKRVSRTPASAISPATLR